MANMKLVDELNLLSHRVNKCWEHLDSTYHAHLLEFNKEYKMTPAVRALAGIDPLLTEGREILYNVQLGEHIDRQDPQWSLAALTVFGNFRGGFIDYPELGYRIRFNSGDFNLVRGRVVKHSIGDFTGQRIAVPHFTHSSTWRSLEMENLVNETVH
jgi:hypothetical protein